jgi:hypothetical protein
MMGEGGLARLLREASGAHAVYERDTLGGVRDDDWADWYAGYMLEHEAASIPGWPAGGRTRKGTAALLTRADASHRASAPQEEWPEYYARYILRGAGRI